MTLPTIKYGIFTDAWGVKELKIKEDRMFFGYKTIHTWTISVDNHDKMMDVVKRYQSLGYIIVKV